VATALRETQEEIGIDPHSIEIIGQLAPFYVPPSNFDIHPTVGYLPDVPQFRPNPAEVAQVITFPITELLMPSAIQSEYHDFQGLRVHVPFFQIAEHKIWGATAVLLSELAERLNTTLR
jgi:8-oxo-dGTP pyrophosphatase MutT (NUDIX family)